MTTDEMASLFTEKRGLGEFLKFDRVTNKRSQRPDLHAFLLLEELAQDIEDIVACAEHDQIWLGVSMSVLAEKITPGQITELIRCGVSYDVTTDSLTMFV